MYSFQTLSFIVLEENNIGDNQVKGVSLVRVTVIGAGNSGVAVAAHLSQAGNQVTLWNRSSTTIAKLMETHLIHCKGIVSGDIPIHIVTDNINNGTCKFT